MSAFLNFRIPKTTKMCVKGLNVRYSEFIILRSIPKGNFYLNSNKFKKVKLKACFWIFNSKLQLRSPLTFTSPEIIGYS